MSMDSKRFSTNTPIDKLLGGGLECGTVTNVYGPAGSGKTNLTLIACLQASKPIFIDTEGGFSTERFSQIGGDKKKLQLINLLEPHSWEEQLEQVKILEKLVQRNSSDLVIVDSLVALYRLVLGDQNFKLVNRQLATQYSILSKIARRFGIPVLVTNQVYGKGDEIEITSSTIAKYWSKCLIEFKRGNRLGHRVAFLRKHRSLPEGKQQEFIITEKGLREPKMGVF